MKPPTHVRVIPGRLMRAMERALLLAGANELCPVCGAFMPGASCGACGATLVQLDN